MGQIGRELRWGIHYGKSYVGGTGREGEACGRTVAGKQAAHPASPFSRLFLTMFLVQTCVFVRATDVQPASSMMRPKGAKHKERPGYARVYWERRMGEEGTKERAG